MNKIKITGLSYFILYLTSCAFAFIYWFYKLEMLPEKYFYDAEEIKERFQKHASFEMTTDSFNNTAALYSMFGVSSKYMELICLACVCVVFGCATKNAVKYGTSISKCIISVFWFALMVVYMSQLSKEFIVLSITSILLFISYGAIRNGLFLCVVLTYGVFFRSYWLLILGFFLAICILNHYKVASRNIIIILFLFYLIINLSAELYLGVPLTSFRILSNEGRIDDKDAATMILNTFGGVNIFTTILNPTITLMQLVIPYPLFMSGGLGHVVVAIMIFWSVIEIRKTTIEKNLSQPSDLKSLSGFIFSFVLVQSIFEPDYGSFVKHLSPLAPLYFKILFWKKNLE